MINKMYTSNESPFNVRHVFRFILKNFDANIIVSGSIRINCDATIQVYRCN